MSRFFIFFKINRVWLGAAIVKVWGRLTVYCGAPSSTAWLHGLERSLVLGTAPSAAQRSCPGHCFFSLRGTMAPRRGQKTSLPEDSATGTHAPAVKVMDFTAWLPGISSATLIRGTALVLCMAFSRNLQIPGVSDIVSGSLMVKSLK